MENQTIVLTYIGQHGAFYPGIPARDLTMQDVIQSGWKIDQLVDSGLYSMAPPPVDDPDGDQQPGDGINATDAARNLADDLAVDLNLVEGTGQDGKITKGDVEKFVEDIESENPGDQQPGEMENE